MESTEFFHVKNGVLLAYTGSGTTAKVPDGVARIAPYVFSEAEELTQILLPDSICEIGAGALPRYEKMRYNEYEGGLYFGCDANPFVAFADLIDKNAERAVLHKDTRVILDRAFYRCRRLVSVFLPEGLRAIGDKAFCECERLQAITIPASVRTIGAEAFASCYALHEVGFEGDAIRLASGAFLSCRALRCIAPPVRVVADYTFSDCAALEQLHLPDDVSYVGEYAFSGCPLPYGVRLARGTAVEENAFDENIEIKRFER